MKHVRIATYEIKKGSFQELADVAQDGMLREFRNQPGFIRYGWPTPATRPASRSAFGRRARTPTLQAVSPRRGTVSTSRTGSS
jgi:hypothetical protein